MRISRLGPFNIAQWISLLALGVASLAYAPTTSATDPMTSPQSIEIREAFAVCRAKPTEMSRFLCHCDVIDQQCVSALKPEHGRWRTIEVWQSESETDREVYFHLAPQRNGVFALDHYDKGIIVSCLLDVSTVTFHLGEAVNIELEAKVEVDGRPLPVDIEEDGMAVIAVARDTSAAKTALAEAEQIKVLVEDEWGEEIELTFRPKGFDHAIAGWSSLCAPATT